MASIDFSAIKLNQLCDIGIDVTKFIIEKEVEKSNEKQTCAILQNYTLLYGTLFRKYRSESRKFIKLTREGNQNRQDVGIKSNGAGVNQDVGRKLSSGVNEKFLLIKKSALSRAQYFQIKSAYRGNFASNADKKSIADLHSLVKQFDSNFKKFSKLSKGARAVIQR